MLIPILEKKRTEKSIIPILGRDFKLEPQIKKPQIKVVKPEFKGTTDIVPSLPIPEITVAKPKPLPKIEVVKPTKIPILEVVSPKLKPVVSPFEGRKITEVFSESFRKGVLQTGSAVETILSIGAKKIGAEQLSNKLKTLSEQDAELAKVGVNVEDSRKFTEKIKDPKWITAGVAQTLPNLLFGMGVAAPAAIIGAPAVVVGGLAFLSSATLEGGFAFQDAKEFGVDDEKAGKVASIVGVANGILEALPITKLLTRSPAGKEIKRKIIREITRRVVNQSVLESGTESLQEIVSNSVATVYDENRDILQGVPESAFFGGLIGGGTSLVLDTFTNVEIKERFKEAIESEKGFVKIPKLKVKTEKITPTPPAPPPPPPPPIVEPLAVEARKYKSAEEFVKAQELKETDGRFGKGGVSIKTTKEGDVFERYNFDTKETEKIGSLKDVKPETRKEYIEARNAFEKSKGTGAENTKKAGDRYFKATQKVKNELLSDEIKTKSQLTDIFTQAKQIKPEVKTKFEKELGKEIEEKIIKKTPIIKERIKVRERLEKQQTKKERRIFLSDIKQDILKVFENKRLDDVKFLNEVQKEIEKDFKVAKGRKRSMIAFIRMIGEFNQTVINEIKREVGVTKPLRQLNAENLDRVIVKIKERLAFKKKRGFIPEIERKEKEPPVISEDIYLANREITESQKPKFSKSLKESGKEIGRTAEKLLGIISTRLANIDISLKRAIRRLEFNLLQNNQKARKKVLPFLKKTKEMTTEDFTDFDLALKNGDVTKINELIDKYKIQDEFKIVREVLDDLYSKANEVGYDVGYLKNYWPRMIKDSEGFLKHFSDREDWSILDEAIKRKETALGRYLSIEEKANLINTMIRGYSGGNITLSETGSMKARKIDFINPEINQFYIDSNVALLQYIIQVNKAIEARKFFGKHKPIDKKEDQFNNIDDSIGFYVTQLLSKGEITPTQEKELKSILQARFNEKGTRGLTGIYKNLSYIDTMGSPFNAITQIGDLAFPLYNITKGRAGLVDTSTALMSAIFNTSKIKKEDIGIERIAQEFDDTNLSGRAVEFVFKVIGLNKIDTVGKETLINPIIQRFQQVSKEPTPEFKKELEDIFGYEIEGSTADDVIRDLQSGEITENVKYLAFSKLLDFQPVALSEVPEQYLKGGNGRIFYMLKTWTIKMFDVYRRESFQLMKTNKVEGVKNFLLLSSCLVLMNATADEIKDFILGRETKLSDRIIDNILKLIGFSRYTTYQIAKQGLGSTLLQQVIGLPTKFIDNIWKDVNKLYKDFDENFNINKLKTVESIPIGGKLYYWWFGKGTESPTKKKPEVEGLKVKINIEKLKVPKLKINIQKLKPIKISD